MPRKTPQCSPAYDWVWTLNNWTVEEREFLSSRLNAMPGCRWIMGEEIGEKEKTPHLQCYAIRPGKWRPLPSLKVGNGRCRFDKAKFGPDTNFNYCSKDGVWTGNLRHSPVVVRTLDEAEEILKKDYEPGTCGVEREAAAVRFMLETEPKNGAFHNIHYNMKGLGKGLKMGHQIDNET